MRAVMASTRWMALVCLLLTAVPAFQTVQVTGSLILLSSFPLALAYIHKNTALPAFWAVSIHFHKVLLYTTYSTILYWYSLLRTWCVRSANRCVHAHLSSVTTCSKPNKLCKHGSESVMCTRMVIQKSLLYYCLRAAQHIPGFHL